MERETSSMNRRRFRPSCASNRVTVRRLTGLPVSLSSKLIQDADHLWSRRIASTCSTTSALVEAGW